MEKIDWENIPVSSAPAILIDTTAPFSSVGNTFGTVSEIGALGETAYLVGKHKVSISKQSWGYRVENGKFLNPKIKGNNFHTNYIESQLKLGNTPRIANHVKVSAAIKTSFKSKLGVAGIAITAGENAFNNIQSNESTSKVVGDAAVDVGLGAVSLATGAAVVSGVTIIGGPLLLAAGAGVVISTLVTYGLEGVKVGKEEKTLSETLKDTVEKGIDTVAGWFK